MPLRGEEKQHYRILLLQPAFPLLVNWKMSQIPLGLEWRVVMGQSFCFYVSETVLVQPTATFHCILLHSASSLLSNVGLLWPPISSSTDNATESEKKVSFRGGQAESCSNTC